MNDELCAVRIYDHAHYAQGQLVTLAPITMVFMFVRLWSDLNPEALFKVYDEKDDYYCSYRNGKMMMVCTCGKNYDNELGRANCVLSNHA